jgi:hypothetical protein
MKRLITFKLISIILLIFSVSALQALDLIIIGPPKSVLMMWDGTEIRIDPTGKYVVHDLSPGDIVSFTTDIPGRVPTDYAVEMGELTKTFRIDPEPTGIMAGEFKLTDAGFCPGFGFELYFNPEDVYVSIDLYQSFISFASVFTGSSDELSAKYIMPMLGTGLYILPFDSPVRINLGVSFGALFANNMPHPLFASEISAGLEFKFFEHYIIFAELNPRLFSPVSTGWENYNDIFGISRADDLYSLGNWALMGFPSTIFGLKIKY